MSRFKEIFFDLETKIINQEFQSGDLLPSEHILSKEYNVSRETIRKALNMLLEHGYIQKIQGKGSIVLDIRRLDLPISGLTGYKEISLAHNLESETILIKNEEIQLPERLAVQLKLPKRSRVHHIIRGRKVDGEVIILDIDYILKDVVDEIPDEEAKNSLYTYFEKKMGLTIGYAKKEFTVEPTTDLDREWMSLHGDTHVVVTRSEVHLKNTALFQFTESRHRVDKFRFVEFARRKSPIHIEAEEERLRNEQ